MTQDSFAIIQPAGKNFTPSTLIYKWAKAHSLTTENTPDGIRVKAASGCLRYMRYQIQPLGNGQEKVTVFLKSAF